jgi:hypothetical protein
VTGHISKRFRTAVFLPIAMLISAAGCGHRLSTPENAATNDELLPTLIGTQITVRGTFSLRGKFGPYILLSNRQMVYLVPKGSFTWGEPYSEMEGKLVAATGTLSFFHSPDSPSPSAGPAVARPPDFFYFAAETAQLRLLSR